jgi:hypothetical protein
MQTAVGRDEALASAPTFSRLENRASRAQAWALHEVLVAQFIASQKVVPAELVLDIDASDVPLHGNQELSQFHAYYDHHCYLPLYVFCGHHLLCAYLRPANLDPATHAWAILSLLVKRFKEVWPDVKIIFRGDSGFCRWRMLRWCEKHDVFYIVGLARNSRLKAMAKPFMDQAEAHFNANPVKQRLFADIEYAAYTWDKERHVIVKAERLEKGPNLRFVVTNLQGEPQALYDELYCKRGEAENRIKEQQLGLFADRTSCHEFVPNQFRVLLSAAAYILLQHLREQTLAGTELAEAQVPTIRTKLLKIGALIKRSFRRVVLHLAGGCPMQKLFRLIAAKLVGVVSSA